MKTIVQAITYFLFWLVVVPAFADSTLVWDRNTDDTVKYRVYYCSGKGCTVTKLSMLSPDIPQPAVGIVPSFDLPANTEGNAAVVAVDAANNESGLSVSVPFDRKNPSVPVNPRVQ